MKKWKIIVCAVAALFIVAAVIAAVVYLPVLKLVFSPNSITVAEREETIATLKRLESAGGVTNLEVSDDGKGVSFFSADKSIKISSEYDGERLRRLSGEFDVGHLGVSTVEEGKEMARVILSPYLDDAEITALFLRYSPDILTAVVNGDINMSFDINNYHVTATSASSGKIDFNMTAK